MNDRKLLELAAKAASIEFSLKRSPTGSPALYCGPSVGWWNPLTDDGDALRLAVKLNFDVMTGRGNLADGTPVVSVVFPLSGDYDAISEPINADRLAATRRAIVRAVAELGRNITQHGDGGGV